MERDRLKELLINFKNQHILIIGDLMLDRYIWGRVDRISPEAPVPIVRVTREDVVCGGAANVAANIANLDARATVLGFIGDDLYGRQLKEELEKSGVSTDELIIEPHRQTVVKTRVIGSNQQIVRVDREEKDQNRLESEHQLMNRVESLLQDESAPISGIILSDYAKGTLTSPTLDFITRQANKRGVFVSVDPKLKNFPLYRNTGVITPNHSEASQTLGDYLDSEEKFLKAGRTLLQRHKSEAILITRGADGMQLFEKSGRVSKISTRARKVYDVTGAGDSVIATFSLAKASGATLFESAELSNFSAGYVVGILGTATCSRENLLQFYDLSAKPDSKPEFS